MNRNSVKIVLFICILVSPNIFSQAIFHPLTGGFGYNYSYSVLSQFEMQTHTFDASLGQQEFFVSYAIGQSEKTKINGYGIGFTFYHMNLKKRIYPSFSVLFVGSDGSFGLGFGISLAATIFKDKTMSILPQIEGSLAMINVKNGDVLDGGSGSFEGGLNFGFNISEITILTVSPSLTFSSPTSFFTMSFGLIITPP